MSNSKKEKKEVSYYGKKAYIVSPILVRRKPETQNVPDYSQEEISTKRPVKE